MLEFHSHGHELCSGCFSQALLSAVHKMYPRMLFMDTLQPVLCTLYEAVTNIMSLALKSTVSGFAQFERSCLSCVKSTKSSSSKP